MSVRLSTIRGWNFNSLGYELNEEGNVKNIYCKTCRDFYMEIGDQTTSSASGSVKENLDKYVIGTHVIKKVNFANHVAKNKDHERAVIRLRERKLLQECNSTSSAEKQSVCAGQSTIHHHVRKLNQRQHNQLQRKFQLAHYIAATAKSFQSYAQFANFESKYHGVDMGSGYLTRQSCNEITKFISLDKRISNITEPLNTGVYNYYSILCDGSSSTKIVDEKELYVIKTCLSGKPNFQVLALEEPDEGNAEGTSNALDNAMSKMEFTFERENKEIGLCSDAASVNFKLWKLLKEDLREQYFLSKCILHRIT